MPADGNSFSTTKKLPVVADTCFLISAMLGKNSFGAEGSALCHQVFSRLSERHVLVFNGVTWQEFEEVAHRPEIEPALAYSARAQFIDTVYSNSRVINAKRAVYTYEGRKDDMVLSVGLASDAPVVTRDTGILDLRTWRRTNKLPRIYSVEDMHRRLDAKVTRAANPMGGKPVHVTILARR